MRAGFHSEIILYPDEIYLKIESQSLVNEGRFPQDCEEARKSWKACFKSQSLVNEGRFPQVLILGSCLLNAGTTGLVAIPPPYLPIPR